MAALRTIWAGIRGESGKPLVVLARVGFAALVVIGIGAAAVGAGAQALDATSTEAFCVSCHEMKQHAYEEYKDTIHAKNRSGVRATCADCHIPHELGPKLVRKLEAAREVWGHLTGVIDTPEKYDALRYEMAKREWLRLKANDSRPCRHCHDEAAMSPDLMSERARSRHEKGKAEGKTCIDCHSGIAHTEPEGGPGPGELKVGMK